MDKNEAREIFDKVLEASIAYRKEHGEVPMSFILIFPDGRMIQVPNIPKASAAQNAEAVRSLSLSVGARYVISTGEAWMTFRNPSEVRGGVAPSKHPDRIETILISIDGPDLQLLATAKINPDGTIEAPEVLPSPEGRFTNLSGLAGIN